MALIKCNECGRMVSDKALACPNCGAPVEKKNLCDECGNEIPKGVSACPSCGCPVEVILHDHNAQQPMTNEQQEYIYDYDTEDEPDHTLRNLLLTLAIVIVAAIVGGLFYFNSQSDIPDNEEYDIVDTTAVVENDISEEDEQQAIIDGQTTWFYGQMEDDLTHEVTAITATILSKNECRFDNYGNTARLCMQLIYSTYYLSTPSTAVLLTFDDGKTNLCRYADSFSSGFKVVFDNGEVDNRWTLIESTPKHNVIFMYMPSKVKPFLAELRSSKTCRIQVNLEHVGMTTFDFSIEGLKWDYDMSSSSSSKHSSPRETDASIEEAVEEATEAPAE